jgi:uncharacterized protein (TIGR03083 family)
MADDRQIEQPAFTDAYRAAKARIIDLVLATPADDWSRTVPACPDWTVHDLLCHMVGIPAELGAGRYPTGDLDGWLAAVVDTRRSTSVADLLDEWAVAVDEAPPMYTPNGLLLVDLVVHEHDLRRTVDRPGARDAAEVTRVVPLILGSLADALRAMDLGAIVVRDGGVSWRSHDAPDGWTIETSPWEATRILESRRSADELRTRFGTDIEPYLAVLGAHLPLPRESLAEELSRPRQLRGWSSPR